MEELIKLMNVCNSYKQGEFDINEFQQRIETVYLPDACKETLEKFQHNSCNRLEEIIYCYKESQKKYADIVADDLIKAVLLEQSRLKELRSYKIT